MAPEPRWEQVADLHTHSRYARATGSTLTLENLARWARRKGLDLLATGDLLHPRWQEELREGLRETGSGLYERDGVAFVLGGEVNCAFHTPGRAGRGHQIHLLLFVPDFAALDRLTAALGRYGDLASDGRPTLQLSADQCVQETLAADPSAFVIPAHIWTPWFSVYGAISGFDHIAECFPTTLPAIFAVETGLSSDPGMNWRIPELDGCAIVSFGDAHSLARLGREATLLDGAGSYDGLRAALAGPGVRGTIEFYPEEGRYHYSGHRAHGLRLPPGEAARLGNRCPVCGRRLTVGVMDRVEALAQRPESVVRGPDGWLRSAAQPERPPYRLLVPLAEVLAQALGVGVASKRVERTAETLIGRFGSELAVLLRAPAAEAAALAGERVAEGLERTRRGEIVIDPGYDGEYGVVRIWPDAAGAPGGVQGRMV